ncbi:Dak phosphatase [Pseudovirgaria hyperparasitica]|uniref:Dak phosphatase n=1 Tax=Pseudovirgaria hyperparasitica TaxID=470096 RepID=A0A6A6WM74_9PEZI|nr:Dak phosphatase [Pseudovirgaria hyperparasitica]KAF2763236.1 Dak phosphatase [Pseudovirgaria hyperparasitica]
MSIVVSQTLPWDKSTLQLDRAERWRTLGPLIRPSISVVNVGKSSVALIDTTHAKVSSIHVGAIVEASIFTDSTFTENDLFVCVVKEAGDEIRLEELCTVIENAVTSLDSQCSIVLQIGEKRSAVRTIGGVFLVTVEKEIEFKHLLALLKSSKNSEELAVDELVSSFLKTATTIEERVHPDKVAGFPSIVHASGKAQFENATKVFEIGALQLLKATKSISGQNTVSIHIADINGLSQLERHIIAHELAKISNSLDIPYHITLSTINFNDHSPRGWTISVCPVPRAILTPLTQPSNPLLEDSQSIHTSPVTANSANIVFEDALVRQILTQGCSALIAAEPVVTEYDTIVGDGDCGLTLKSGAEKVLSFIEGKDLSNLPQVLGALVDDLEATMGGTSGALYCIFLSSLAQNLRTARTVPDALDQALSHLLDFTRARKGDRTCLDTLIPFVEILKTTEDVERALQAARKGNEETKNMQARLGRSAYLDDSATRGVPDPGAYGLLVLLEGLASR